MATSKLTTLAQQKSQAQHKTMSRDSLRWLQSKVDDLKGRSNIAKNISREDARWVNKFQLGGMYFFYYDPKTKSDLPYYDRFPLVIPLQRNPNGFLGLNLHYLPIHYRLVFLDKLLDLAVTNKNDEIFKLRVTYDILEASKRFKEFRPCIKQYITGNIQSKIIAVQPNEWDIAAFLPVQQFKKASSETVWQESVDQIRNN
jgi:hypothetical protein